MSQNPIQPFGDVMPNDFQPFKPRTKGLLAFAWPVDRLKSAIEMVFARRRLYQDARILAEYPPSAHEANQLLEELFGRIVTAVRTGRWNRLPEGNRMTLALLKMANGWPLLAKTGRVDVEIVADLRATAALDFGWYWERQIVPRLLDYSEAIIETGALIPRFADDGEEFSESEFLS